MTPDGITDFAMQLLEGIRLCEYGLSDGSGGKSPLRGFFNQKNQLLHKAIITKWMCK